MKKHIIYKFTSPTKKCYIGQTHNEKDRMRCHLKKETDFTDKSHFAYAIQKYGFNKFTYEIIDYADNQEEANEKEIYWIEFYDSINSGYNTQKGGAVTANYLHDDRVVEDIIHLLKNTNLKQKEIAERMGVSIPFVSRIKMGDIRNSTAIVRPSHQSQKGSQNKLSKLSEEQVKEIREKLQAGAKRKDLQDEYKVSKTLIQLIATNQMWGHVETNYQYSKKDTNGNAKLTKEIVIKLKEDLKNGMIAKKVAEKYKISEATVNQIKYGKTWKDV